MPDIRLNFEIHDYSTYNLASTDLADGELRYFSNVVADQVNNVPVMGDGVSAINTLPFLDVLEVITDSNVNLAAVRITGNKVKIHNSGATAITVNVGTSGTPVYEYINAGDTEKAFFDGAYWKVDDGFKNGDIKAFHKNFGGRSREIPWGWVECDGSVISNAGSVDDGETLNDLNGDARFLRGGSTSGTEQADAFQGHRMGPLSPALSFYGNGNNSSGLGASAFGNVTTTGDPVTDGVNGTPRTASETRPINMTVVFIMKI